MTKPVYIFGADPGIDEFGWATLKVPQVGRPALVAGGVIQPKSALRGTFLKEKSERKIEQLQFIEEELEGMLCRAPSPIMVASEFADGWSKSVNNGMLWTFGAFLALNSVCHRFKLSNAPIRVQAVREALGIKMSQDLTRTQKKQFVENEVRARIHGAVPFSIEDIGSKDRRSHVFDAAAVALAAHKMSGFMTWRRMQ